MTIDVQVLLRMDQYWRFILLGLLQGVIEWLPISSQGNMMLFMIYLLGLRWTDALRFSIYLHIGTLFAAVFFFRRDLKMLLVALPKYHPRKCDRVNRLLSFLIFTSIISGFVGFLIYRFAEETYVFGEGILSLIGFALIITGLIQKLSRSFGVGSRDVDDLRFLDILLLGVVQGFSAFPGISRSGITISTLLLRGFKGEWAVRLSFLMSIPAVSVAVIGLSLSGEQIMMNEISNLLLSVATSLIVGLISIHALVKMAEKVKFWVFCFFIGFLAILPSLFSQI